MEMVEEGEYKGNPMLVIRRDAQDKFPFQFGVRKAELILRNLNAIKKFVAKHGEIIDA